MSRIVATRHGPVFQNKKVAPEAAAALHVDAKLITAFLERHLTAVEVIESDKVEVRAAEGRCREYRAFRGVSRRIWSPPICGAPHFSSTTYTKQKVC